jgi:hypothetical protein
MAYQYWYVLRLPGALQARGAVSQGLRGACRTLSSAWPSCSLTYCCVLAAKGVNEALEEQCQPISYCAMPKQNMGRHISNVPEAFSERRDLAEVIHSDVCKRKQTSKGNGWVLFWESSLLLGACMCVEPSATAASRSLHATSHIGAQH